MARKGGLSTSEKTWVIYYNRKGEQMFAITSTPIRDKYYLYKRIGDGWNKIDKASSPGGFEDKFSIRETINTK